WRQRSLSLLGTGRRRHRILARPRRRLRRPRTPFRARINPAPLHLRKEAGRRPRNAARRSFLTPLRTSFAILQKQKCNSSFRRTSAFFPPPPHGFFEGSDSLCVLPLSFFPFPLKSYAVCLTIALISIRLDGFAAWRADDSGLLVTQPFVCEG